MENATEGAANATAAAGGAMNVTAGGMGNETAAGGMMNMTGPYRSARTAPLNGCAWQPQQDDARSHEIAALF